MKKTIRKGILLILIPVMIAVLASCSFMAKKETHAVILATSDIHGNVWGYSYGKDTETDNDGMARLYTYISKVRDENETVFLVDGGDEIQGNVMTDDIANKTPDKEHPVMTAMNFMEYDSMTLGNHEFDWGIETMKTILQQADFPILGANIRNQDKSCVIGDGWVIVERGGIKLAVIGVCTPDIPIWDGDKEGVADVTFEPADEAVKRAVKEIGDKADIILVSAHMGQYAEFDEEGGSDSGEKIVDENPEVDILQLAHMHITVDTKINGIPTVAVRNNGREIARIDVTLDRKKNIKDISTSIVEMADYEPSEEIRDIPIVKELHEQAISYEINGAGDGDSEAGDPGRFIGTSTAKFQPEDEIKGLPSARSEDTALMDLVLKVQLLNSGADVTASPLFGDTDDLPEGDIYYNDILSFYKFDNTLCTLDVTGRELKAYMEYSANAYNQWKPGDINISYDPDQPGYLQDIFAGVDYEINISKPKGERIENVMFKGQPLKDDQVLKLAVNNYRYSACLKPENLVSGSSDWESTEFIRDMIADYIAENSPVSPDTDNNWRVTGIDLSEDDPRRKEIIGYINDGQLPVPYNESYNLNDYDALITEVDSSK